ncbi:MULTISPECIES: MarR family winged helix-turn-helix transcriptional regulator [Clostridium]|uniref:MarR family winged helix-turn-helix transcriptional regulator n=1 Tax=Clostridium TaxID=1485 RepID=UPI000825233D|nr:MULTISPECIES: MarR family transcriptional regulator [Clostridium]PJI10513.1 MarR family transcriptional regulator [Clostridium sp. CT7]
MNNIDNSINLIARIREKANKFILKELEALGLKNIAPSHGDILSVLFKRKEATMTELADIIHRDRSTVTALVNKLTTFGYISTRKDPNDSRSTIVYLTEKGENLKSGFREISYKLYKVEYKGISDEEKALFQSLLERIYKNF